MNLECVRNPTYPWRVTNAFVPWFERAKNKKQGVKEMGEKRRKVWNIFSN
jgi:hypothetical protein